MEKVLELIKEGFEIKGKIKFIEHSSITGEKLSETPFFDNLIVLGTNLGKGAILQWLSTNINYGAIGTSNTAPTAADTQLGAEVLRVASPVVTIAGNVVSFQFFFPDGSLANGTYYEVGSFIAGTVTPNSGNIFNHGLFSSGYVKTSNVDTTVQIDFTIT